MQTDSDQVARDVNDVLDQHQTLLGILGALGERPGPEKELAMLVALQTMLGEHFELEEQPGGFFARVLDEVPHAVASVGKLTEEHGVLSAQAAEVVQAAKDCLDGPLAALRAKIDALADALRDHERREANLLADAMFNDIGGHG